MIGAQGDTLANMVNTYYAMRYRAATTNSPAYGAMGFGWSAWTDPPALAEGWVQRVLNNVTPFAQRMRDLVENEAETAVSMIRQAGPPFEGDVALNQDNLKEVGLIQLYETLLDKAESMSLQLGIDDPDANKQLQLAVGRLGDLYRVLGDEAYTDALNPTIGFGANFNTMEQTGYEMDYGALSSALFAFDNQVPTLLDEELALLRGRTGENAPSTKLSPYYNRLVWNFTRGLTAGEVAYAVNYDISGNRKGVIDYDDAAEMFPQGHGDAYGHYLSALAGYYRLLRNPHFTWGEPAMGEMVVADAALNVDYYDEATFARAAYDVAKTALAVVDRTARKTVRENGGAPGAGYLDENHDRAFGYGEWAARGGYGALANWAVANTLLPEKPTAGRYWRFLFDGPGARIRNLLPLAEPLALAAPAGPWTVEFQLAPSEPSGAAGGADEVPVLCLENETAALRFVRDPATGRLSAERCTKTSRGVNYDVTFWLYRREETLAEGAEKDDAYAEIAVTNGTRVVECGFFSTAGAFARPSFPTNFVDSGAFEAALAAPPAFGGWVPASVSKEENGEVEPTVYQVGSLVYDYARTDATEIGEAPAGATTLVALVCPGVGGGAPRCLLFDAEGALTGSAPLSFDPALSADSVVLGGGYEGEIGELRAWSGAARADADLVARRGYVSPFTPGLAFYLRPIAPVQAFELLDEAADSIVWEIDGGDWIEARESGMAITFEDEGLLRIDRDSVSELSALADLVPAIQKKLDQMDAGLNPLGLASGAIPFDLAPGGLDDGTSSHYEQIRERAGVALANARKALERAQFAASRLRLLQEAEEAHESRLAIQELEFKNKLIEYFGYPYAGDIGPGGTYPQGYDGPDLCHYLWMDPAEYDLKDVQDTLVAETVWYKGATAYGDWIPNLDGFDDIDEEKAFTFQKSATGVVLKPANVSGKRLADGRIQEALGQFLLAYGGFKRAITDYEYADDQFKYEMAATRSQAVRDAVLQATEVVNFGIDSVEAASDGALKATINTLEFTSKLTEAGQRAVLSAVPSIVGAGMTVNTDPRAIVAAGTGPGVMTASATVQTALLTAKNSLVFVEAADRIREAVTKGLEVANQKFDDLDAYYQRMRDAADAQYDAAVALGGKWKELQVAQKAVETVAAEAERIIDERTLMRSQATDVLTKARYNEMFFRLARNNALSRYDTMFDLAQKYAFLAAQAYDYETGLLSSDPQSGERFLAEIVGARTLGEFDGDGEPCVTSGDGDGGLADILARMDQNWLVLKPRLGINNPQKYATWFSLRQELFRVYPDARGDKAWRTALEKCWVDDLRALPEFAHYCQPLAGSSAEAEPGIVIPFPTEIVFGRNFFGADLAGGDAALDPTWFSTRIAGAGVHFEGYNERTNGYGGALPLSRTPTAYLVPVGEDRMRAPGDAGKVVSWRVVDQTVPTPYAIGSTELDNPDWTPLHTGATGGNDLGARIRKHPSFRAYPGATGEAPGDDELDATRLIGRSAWNTKWLLVIPAGGLGANREEALAAFIRGWDADRDGALDVLPVRDILLGLRTYSRSGN